MSRCVRGWGLGWRVYPPRGSSAHTGRIPGRHKNGKYAAVTRGRPAFQRHESHAEGSDTTPMQERQKSTVCRREQRVRRRRAPTLRKPFFLLKQPRAGLFRHSHSSLRVSDTPHTEMQKSAVRREKNSLKVSRRNILFLCRRWKIPLHKPLFPIGAETPCYGSFYHLRWRWPASHLSGLRRSRCPAKCTGRGMAPHPIFGQKPTPTFSYDWRKT